MNKKKKSIWPAWLPEWPSLMFTLCIGIMMGFVSEHKMHAPNATKKTEYKNKHNDERATNRIS